MRRFIRANVEDPLAEAIISDYGRKICGAAVGYSKKEDDEVVKMTPEKKPYKISVHEFGVYEHYSQVSCLYFTDKVLVEEMNMELLEDVDGAIGLNNLNDFEDEYIDAVYVRNDRLQIDYEILRDWRTYSEAIKTKPRLQED